MDVPERLCLSDHKTHYSLRKGEREISVEIVSPKSK